VTATSAMQVKQTVSIAPVTAQSQMFITGNSSLNIVKQYLTDLVSQSTKIPAAQIDTATALESYGIDSVMIMAMNEKLEGVFGQSVPRTLFFEYQDIDSLVDYFVENHAEDIRKLAPEEQEIAVIASEQPVFAPSQDSLLDVVRVYLSALFSRFTKIEQSQIDYDTPIENYGIDSVMIMGMNEDLENTFGQDIPKTLFFEYQTINELAEFLLENHSAEVQALVYSTGTTVVTTTTTSTAIAINETQVEVTAINAKSRFANSSTEISYAQNQFAHPEHKVNEPTLDYLSNVLHSDQEAVKDNHLKLSATEQLKRTISALSDSEVEHLLREMLESDELEAEF
ncbi:MAG: acyl carrier protein, partial [Candidatus Saccharibacteria bacterium]|nr:acyl carrier protein [Candidatus Saccharibacteria bacterium]